MAARSEVDDNEPVALRSDTLAALQEVLRERREAAERATRDADDGRVALATPEDWNASQFWYDERTASALAAELLTLAAERHAATGGADVTLALLSCPSAYKALLAASPPPYVCAWLFEYDARFAVFGPSFVPYDFRAPHDFPPALRGAVDVVMMDPPFLQADCLAGFARTAMALRRDNSVRLLLCSGAVMLTPARRLLGVRPTPFHVGHAKRLSNPFALFVNYDDAGRLGGVDEEAEAAVAREGSSGGVGGSSGNSGDER